MYVCMYVCTYVRIYVCMYVCICMHECMCICMYIITLLQYMSVSECGLVSTCVSIYPNNCSTCINEISMRIICMFT